MVIIFLGPPAAGKGSTAELVEKNLHIDHVSTGDIFRRVVTEGTEQAKKIKKIMESGQLISDEITASLVQSELPKHENILLDGFPRTLPQGKILAGLAKIDAVYCLTAPEEVSLKRLSGRRVCQGCQRVYNIFTQPPAKEGTCDSCGAALIQRGDDTEETILKRLSVYNEQTAPLVPFYREAGLLTEIRTDIISPEEAAQKVEDDLKSRGLL